MPWYTFSSKRPSPDDAAVPAALTAAASPPKGPEAQFVRHPDKWQNEVWNYYDTLGEFNYGVWWLSNMLSRVRLRAAKLQPDVDEPDVQDKGPAADLMMRLGGGVSGQAQIMKRLTVQLSLPGEGYLIGENVDGVERWQVRSVDEIRAQSGSYYVMDEESVSSGNQWRPVADDNHVVRVWRPHDRYYHLADSPSRSAREIMRELELVNRHISAQYLSRLASAGLLKIPDEITFPVREEFLDAPNPIMSEFIEIAAEAIKTPGTASAVIPIPISGPAEALKEMGLVDFTLKIDEKIIEKRESAIKRLATKLDLPAEILLGMGDVNHWCTLDRVRIMTRTGWKTHDQLTVGEDVLTLNHDTGLSEWQPLLAVNTWDVTDEPMVTITGRRHSSTTTLNHRWPVLSGKPGHRGRTWTTTEELMHGAHADGHDAQRQEYLALAAPSADIPTEAKYSDALVELVAWYFTEGSEGIRPGRNTPKVTIYQSHVVNPGNCARIRRALTALFGPESATLDKGGRYSTPESVERRAEARRLREEDPKISLQKIGDLLGVSGAMVSKYLKLDAKTRDTVPKWRTRSKTNGMTDFVLNSAAAEVVTEHAPLRRVSLDFVQHLTATQLDLFLDTAVRGDGSRMTGAGTKGRGTAIFGQKIPAMCDAFELAAILSGRSVNRYTHTGEGRSADGPRLRTQHMVSVAEKFTTFAPRGRSFEEHTYTGTIWCPTTPNRSWLAEDNGHVFFTGNSAWALDEAALKTHIAPVAELICDSLTRGYLQPRLAASGEDPADWVVWYDMSELALRPDRSTNAGEAYDRMELSGQAYRRELGFDEDDKPMDEDLVEQGLKIIVRTVPNAAPAALDKLTGQDVLDPDLLKPAAPKPTGPTGVVPPQGNENAPPGTQEKPPPAQGQAASARLQQSIQQARTQHAIRFGTGSRWELLHPEVCAGQVFGCPFTHAVSTAAPMSRPGTSGTYLCHLDAFGLLAIDGQSPYMDTTKMLTTSLVPRSNGHART